ncbi:MAG: ABC transporter permease [Actinomycetota bacterium]
MSGLAGIGTIMRLVLRRDRIRIPVWIAALAGLVVASAASVIEIYGTQQEIDVYAASVGGNPAVVAMTGPPHALDTIGGVVVYETTLVAVVGVALMSIFLVTRHTRGEEETGRAELLQAAVVGRHARLTATLFVAAVTNLLLGLIIAVGLASLDLPVGGAVAFGLSMTGLGLVFAALAAVSSQVAEYGRAAAAITGAAFGAAFVIRAAGDVGNGVLSWFSPIGWAQAIRAFGAERWWTLLLLLGFAVFLAVLAFVLESRRDVGGGLIPPRPGPANAPGDLSGPFGLATRLQRAGLLGWGAGVFFLGLAYGSMSNSIEDLVESNPDLREVLAQQEASLTDSFFATGLLIVALVVGGCAIQSMLRLRGEESAGRVESLLATATSRDRWASSHAAVAFLGATAVLALGGLGAGLAHSLIVDDWSQLPRLMGAAMANAPAVWFLGALALALFGVVPRAVALAWAVLSLSLVAGMLGRTLDLPGWVLNLSPFHHLPSPLIDDLTVAPLLVLTALAAGLVLLGLASFRRRDLALH